jgi:23S rRNA (guanosine2251-2'-O)-methyltransferase
MERYRRGKGKKGLLGSHQKCWIWGRNAVLETLKSPRWEILDLHLSTALTAEALREARRLAEERGLAVTADPPEVLTRLCHSTEHQGYLARMTDFPYWAADEALAALPPTPLCVVLDGIQDPYNLGAVIRSAEVFGVDALFIGASGQVGVTSMVVRSSAGAVNRVPIVRVEDLEHLAGRLKARGLALVGASEKARDPLSAVDFKRPAAIVIGSEGTGIQPALRAACGALVQIPQFGQVGSLNAAVAASIFFYEARRQRGAVAS